MSDSVTVQNSEGETFAEVIDVIGVSEVKKAFQQSVKEGSLHKWFKGSKSKDGKPGWVNVVTGGTCASDEPGEGTPKCVSASKRASMTKAERLSASRRKKKADPGQQAKTGAAKPTYVSTDKKKKMNEQIKRDEYGDPIGGPKISKKDLKKNLAKNEPDRDHTTDTAEGVEHPKSVKKIAKELDAAVKMHTSQAKRLRKAGISEAKDKKGKGSGTKDACYHKVKSRYSVWPSAYASGALVKCRKVGAANWGNKSESVEMKNYLDKKAKMLTKKRDAQSDAAKNNPHFDSTQPSPSGRNKYEEVELGEGQKCWKGYEKKGTKKMFGKTYNNCVKKEEFSNWREEVGYEGKDDSKKIEEAKSPAWQRKAGKSESGGLNKKGVASYRAANPGSKLKTAVTTKPSKLKKGSKAANRRKSFCKRMTGMKKKLTSAKTARDPDSRINKSLRKWNC